MKPDGMTDEIYGGYLEQGFSESEIAKIWQDTLYFRAKLAEKKDEREITCTNYENAQRRMTKDVENWMGRR